MRGWEGIINEGRRWGREEEKEEEDKRVKEKICERHQEKERENQHKKRTLVGDERNMGRYGKNTIANQTRKRN